METKRARTNFPFSLSLRSGPPGLLAAAVCFCAAAASAEVGDLRVTEVLPTTGEVEVTNTSPEGFIVATPPYFSHRQNETAVIPPGTEFGAGESQVFTLSGLDASASDIWLYEDLEFDNPDSIITGMVYGPPGSPNRTDVAVAAGIWPSTDASVSLPPEGESARLNTFAPTMPANWVHSEPDLGEYFGTGDQIEQPLPTEVPGGDVAVGLELVADGLISPLGIRDPDDGSGRLFILDQAGMVWILRDGEVDDEPFLDVRDRMVTLGSGFNERGLLGLALHPDFPDTPKVYTHISVPVEGDADFMVPRNQDGSVDHHSVIVEWEVSGQDPDAIDPDSYRELMRIEQPQGNHNGGTIGFGPDRFLYISLGDGGSGDDVAFGHAPQGNGQHLGIINGSIVRIDPEGDNSANGRYGIPGDNPFIDREDALDEIYMYGLRNPYRFSFDQETGDMYIGDAGQHDIESVYLGERAANFGWRITEGSFFFRPQRPDGRGFVVTIPEEPLPDDLVDPIAEYTIRNSPRQVIIGGYVYRGSAVPQMAGRYVFSDWNGEVFYLDEENTVWTLGLGPDNGGMDEMRITGFGQDAQGEVYILGSDTSGPTGDTGRIFQIVPPDLRVVSVERVDGSLRVEFESPMPAAAHRVEARENLGEEPGWEDLELDIEEISDSLFRVDIQRPDTGRHFFRIVGGP